MATIKDHKTTNSLHAAIALIDASVFCDDVNMAVNTIKVIMKTEFKSTKKTREIHSILILLSKVMPLISKSIKSQASKCTPPGMNPTYVRSRMQSTSNPLGKIGVERLQLLLKDTSPKEDTVTQRKQQPKRKKATSPATVSPNKSSSPSQPSSDYPVPQNNQHFLIAEAVQAFQDYPNKKQKLLSYWEQQKFVPKYSTGRRHWNKMCLKMKDGTPLREWQFDDQGNFTFKKRQGRPSIVPTDQVKTFFEEAIPLGENVNSSHVKDMIASATKANDEAKGLYQEVLGRSNVKKEET